MKLKLSDQQRVAREAQRDLKRREKELERALAKLDKVGGPGTVSKGVVRPPAAAARAKKKVSKQPAATSKAAAGRRPARAKKS